MSEASFDRRAGWWLRRATVWLIGGVVVSVLGLVILNHASPIPISRLKNWPHSPWVTDRTGGVMLTVVSDNGQWRFGNPKVIHLTVFATVTPDGQFKLVG